MKSYITILIMIFLASCASKERQCILDGKIVGEKKETLLLFKASKFPNIEAEIPISDSVFSHTIDFSYPEAYELIFKDEFESGSMTVTSFFSEKGTVKFVLKPRGRPYDNKIIGGPINSELNNYTALLRTMFWDEVMKYSDSLRILMDNGTALSDETNEVLEQLRETKSDSVRGLLYNELKYLENTGKKYAPKANKYTQIQDSIQNLRKLWEFNYIEKNTSILSYYKFMVSIKETAKSCCWQPVDIELTNKAQSNLDRYIRAFPKHPYNEIIQNTINGLLNIHSGGRFIDFNLPDIEGQNISLSTIVKENKLTLLDFWSTWCGPCLRTNKELIPIYEQYREKGFEILGVTHVYGKPDSLISFIQNHNYPWPNVIDFDGKNGLWDKYNLSNQAGGLFLINASGQIVGVNLTAAKIKETLEEILN